MSDLLSPSTKKTKRGFMFCLCGGESRKKNVLDELTRNKNEVEEIKAGKLEEQQQLFDHMKMKKEEAKERKRNNEEEKVIKMTLRQVLVAMKKAELLETFLKHYEAMELDYMTTINQIELANTMSKFNEVLKRKQISADKMEELMNENEEIKNQVEEIEKLVEDDNVDVSGTEKKLAIEAVDPTMAYLRDNIWKFVEDFSKKIIKSFTDQFDLHYIKLNKVITIDEILAIVNRDLEDTFSLYYGDLLGNKIMDEQPFLKEGSMEMIESCVRDLVLTWIREKVFDTVSVFIKEGVSNEIDCVFDQVDKLRVEKSIQSAFTEALKQMEKKVVKVFETQWKECLKQGALKTQFDLSKQKKMNLLEGSLKSLLPVEEMEQSSLSGVPQSLPSVPTHLVETSPSPIENSRVALLDMWGVCLVINLFIKLF